MQNKKTETLKEIQGLFFCDKVGRFVPFFLILCVFNGILTGQNIEKNGRLNIINKVQTEWSVMIYAKKWKEGPD